MPTIDDFIRPKEWVSDFVSELGKVKCTPRQAAGHPPKTDDETAA